MIAAVIDRFDGLWGFDLPYMLCVRRHRPTIEAADWHLHVELLPPHRNPTA